MKYRKKPVVIEATQWFKNGDHPQDDCHLVPAPRGQMAFKSEGKVVRHFCDPAVFGGSHCKHCNNTMHNHGWIDTLEGGHIVCPGDYVITGVAGERYPCKPGIFAQTYDTVTD